jgi:hypothetical protein
MRRLFSLAVILVAQQLCFADFINVTKFDGSFLAGTGIPTASFTTNDGLLGAQTGIQVRSRDTGFPLSQVGNQYYVAAGLASNMVSPWWQFDFQFSPGQLGLDPSTTTLRLRVDFDPSAAIAFTDVILPANAWGSAFRTNPANGSWSDNTTPWAVSESWHMGFAFWQSLGAPMFDPNVTGQYAIQFGAYSNEETIAETTVFANVVAVPAPPGVIQAGTGMGLAGLLWLLQRLRNRRARSVAAAA